MKIKPLNCVAPLTVIILTGVAAYTIAALQLPKGAEQAVIISTPFGIIGIGLMVQRMLRRIK